MPEVDQSRLLGPAIDDAAPDLGPAEDEPDDTVLVVVAHDTPPGRFMPQPVYVRVLREHVADWDERYWERVR